MPDGFEKKELRKTTTEPHEMVRQAVAMAVH